MRRIALTVAALCAALSPAALGLWGNASFSQAVPVDVPPSAEVVTLPAAPPSSQVQRSARATPTVSPRAPIGDDHGGASPRDRRSEPGDDREAGGRGAADAVATRTPAPVATTELGDDHGGDAPRDQRTESGDDRDQPTSTADDSSGSSHDSEDDRSGTSGHDDSDDRGSGGHGSDDGSTGDDHGSHGSDD